MEGRWTEAVVDSSVVVKWFSKEQESDRALRVMDRHVDGSRRLWVSDLLYHEVANALRYKADFDEKRLSMTVEELFGLDLNTRQVDPSLLEKASMLAYGANVSIYDAVPVALALLRRTVCITADEQTQYKKLKAHGYPVALLSDETV